MSGWISYQGALVVLLVTMIKLAAAVETNGEFDGERREGSIGPSLDANRSHPLV